ncbi:MAG: hypothetical protein Q4C00_05110 [Bacillota bacterium]|nr:hypothetical protein [Bacillota bacterium]
MTHGEILEELRQCFSPVQNGEYYDYTKKIAEPEPVIEAGGNTCLYGEWLLLSSIFKLEKI